MGERVEVWAAVGFRASTVEEAVEVIVGAGCCAVSGALHLKKFGWQRIFRFTHEQLEEEGYRAGQGLERTGKDGGGRMGLGSRTCKACKYFQQKFWNFVGWR
ncbi:cell division protein FtsK [Babesia caballi]|uniref:Cell division protein FtsK n=1 Tax=Babesia caballi TaxID=5871 RepID=A0AAV4LPW8_BABCB|nr:cell division protein FtsK [Babesia caballi]